MIAGMCLVQKKTFNKNRQEPKKHFGLNTVAIVYKLDIIVRNEAVLSWDIQITERSGSTSLTVHCKQVQPDTAFIYTPCEDWYDDLCHCARKYW